MPYHTLRIDSTTHTKRLKIVSKQTSQKAANTPRQSLNKKKETDHPAPPSQPSQPSQAGKLRKEKRKKREKRKPRQRQTAQEQEEEQQKQQQKQHQHEQQDRKQHRLRHLWAKQSKSKQIKTRPLQRELYTPLVAATAFRVVHSTAIATATASWGDVNVDIPALDAAAAAARGAVLMLKLMSHLLRLHVHAGAVAGSCRGVVGHTAAAAAAVVRRGAGGRPGRVDGAGVSATGVHGLAAVEPAEMDWRCKT